MQARFVGFVVALSGSGARLRLQHFEGNAAKIMRGGCFESRMRPHVRDPPCDGEGGRQLSRHRAVLPEHDHDFRRPAVTRSYFLSLCFK